MLAHLLGPDKKPEHLDELQSAGASDDMRPHADRRQTLGTGADEFHLVFAVAGFRQRFGKAEGKLFDASVTAETGQDEGDSCHDVLSARAREKGLAGPSRCTLQAGKSKGSAQGFHAAPAGAENQPFLPVFPALYYRACSILHSPRARPLPQPPFLPTTRAEMDAIGWDSLDILLVTGDAYVDHPSFGVPLLGRWLVGHGYRVGIVAQPRWRTRGRASPTSPAWAAPAYSPG